MVDNAARAVMGIWKLMLGIGIPTAIVAGGAGAFLVMGGNYHEGVKRVKWALTGLTLLGAMPLLANIFAGIGNSIGGGS